MAAAARAMRSRCTTLRRKRVVHHLVLQRTGAHIGTAWSWCVAERVRDRVLHGRIGGTCRRRSGGVSAIGAVRSARAPSDREHCRTLQLVGARAGRQWARAGPRLGAIQESRRLCAVAVEVEVDQEVRLLRVWCAADAGLVINPDGARNQLEGGIVQAASMTLKEQVRMEGDGITSLDWAGYPILRFSEVPEIEHGDHPRAGPADAGHGRMRRSDRPPPRSATRSRMHLARASGTCRSPASASRRRC